MLYFDSLFSAKTKQDKTLALSKDFIFIDVNKDLRLNPGGFNLICGKAVRYIGKRETYVNFFWG